MNVDNKLLNFVLRHYREGAFDTPEALRSVKQRVGEPLTSGPRRPAAWRWVAVAASLLCLVAFAAVMTIRTSAPSASPSEESVVVSSSPSGTAVAAPKTFHFDNTPLPEVLADLSAYYGVVLTADREDCRLTADFTADSLNVTIRLIEEVLDVNISQSQK